MRRGLRPVLRGQEARLPVRLERYGLAAPGRGWHADRRLGRREQLDNSYETHNTDTSPSFPNGCGTVWRGNSSDLGGVGDYAIKITSTSKCSGRPNVVYASNTVTRAVSGLTNVAVTP